MHSVESRRTLSNGVLHSRRRRPPDWFAVLLTVVLITIGVTVTSAGAWATVWLWQDIARRLGG